VAGRRGAGLPAIGVLAAGLFLPGAALAHASEQSLVLLLPTALYAAGGTLAVALTVAVISGLPARVAAGVAGSIRLVRLPRLPGRMAASCLSAAVLWALVAIGALGPRDPTENALPLVVWTGFWVIAVLAQALTGAPWRWIEPWSGPLWLARRAGIVPLLRLPAGAGHWPALAGFSGLAMVLLVHPAAADPDWLAAVVALYWMVHALGGLVFGPVWLTRCETFTALMRAYGSLAPVGRVRGGLRLGLPGWQALRRPAPPLSAAILMVALLAVGSFDGLYETFAWYDLLALNPLEPAGRSAMVARNAAGLALALPLLLLAHALCLRLGAVLSGQALSTAALVRAHAPALLPIAAAYHLAHYLPGTLVEAQAILPALTDPFGSGADWLGLGPGHVTTGFLNRLDSVRLIWLAQAGAVVAGHMLAVLMSHAIATRLVAGRRAAALSQVPVAAFMLAYTMFGLWLLASPRAG
jgi:hypothetical protein